MNNSNNTTIIEIEAIKNENKLLKEELNKVKANCKKIEGEYDRLHEKYLRVNMELTTIKDILDKFKSLFQNQKF